MLGSGNILDGSTDTNKCHLGHLLISLLAGLLSTTRILVFLLILILTFVACMIFLHYISDVKVVCTELDLGETQRFECDRREFRSVGIFRLSPVARIGLPIVHLASQALLLRGISAAPLCPQCIRDLPNELKFGKEYEPQFQSN